MEAAQQPDPDNQQNGDPEDQSGAAPQPVEHLIDTKAGALEVLRLDDLQIDHRYQRELSNDLVDRIAKSWDITIAGPILVSRRPSGALFVVDGGHRAAAARLAGETEVLARVFDGLTREEEANKRLQGNVRRTDKPYERFRAQIAAGNAESLAIQAICEQFETRINPYPNPKEGINSVSAIEVLYRRDKGILLTRVLEIIQDAWGQVAGPSGTVPIVKSVAFFLQRHVDEMSRTRYVERLQAVGLTQLHRMGVNHRAIHSGAMWTNYYRAMVEAYNERLTPANRIEVRLGKLPPGFQRREGGERGD